MAQTDTDWGDPGQSAPEKTYLQTVREAIHSYSPQAIAQSIWQDPKGAAQTADDAVRAAANTVTFGQADRLAGYLGGTGTDAEVQRSLEARQRSPKASLAGDIAGGVALPGFGAEALAARWGGGLAGRAGAYGLTGAGTGAAQGAGNTYSGDVRDYVTNALIGGALGAGTGAAGGAVFGGRPAVSAAKTPTVDETRAFKNYAYDLLKANPARYDAQHWAQRANEVENAFATRYNFGREYSPGSFKALDQMRQPYAAAVREAPDAISTITPANVDFVRQGLNRIPYGKETKTDIESARHVKRAMDDFLERPPVGAVMPGSEAAAAAAGRTARLARESNAGFERAATSADLIQRAEGRAGAYATPLGIEQALRQEYKNFLLPNVKTHRSRAQEAGYSPTEMNLMDAFSKGVDTPGRNALRAIAGTFGGRGGLTTLGAAGVGGAYFAPGEMSENRLAAAAALPAVGFGARLAGNRIARNAVQKIDETLRQRNPLYQMRVANAPMMPGPGSAPGAAQATRDAITAALLHRQPTPADTDEWR